jgi:hypothetical protein
MPLFYLISFFRKRAIKKQMEKLTNDPEYQAILKEYNIEPIPWDKNFTLSDLPAFRKKKKKKIEL